MKSREIPEGDALRTLLQSYQAVVSTWVAGSISMGIGLIAVPLYVMMANSNSESIEMLDTAIFFTVTPRFLCFLVTLLLLVGIVYVFAKVFYFTALIDECEIRLRLIGEEKSLANYSNKMKEELSKRNPIFGLFRTRTPAQYVKPGRKRLYLLRVGIVAVVTLAIALIMFLLVWMNMRDLLLRLSLSEGVLAILLVIMFWRVPVG